LVKNTLFNPEFQALHESEFFTPKKCNLCEKKRRFRGRNWRLFGTGIFIATIFHEGSFAAT